MRWSIGYIRLLTDKTEKPFEARYPIGLYLIDCFDAVTAMYHLPSEADSLEAEGVISRIPKNISIPIFDEYRGAFSVTDQKGAHIIGTISDKDIELSTVFDETTGKATASGVRILESLGAARSKEEQRSFVPFEGNLSFVKTMYTIANDQYKKNPDVLKGTISISRAALCNHLGIRYSNRRRKKDNDQQSTAITSRVQTIAKNEEFFDDIDEQIKKHFE